jgi:hypothetical protein
LDSRQWNNVAALAGNAGEHGQERPLIVVTMIIVELSTEETLRHFDNIQSHDGLSVLVTYGGTNYRRDPDVVLHRKKASPAEDS